MCLNYLNKRHKLDMPPLMGKTPQNDKERSISEKDEAKMASPRGFEPLLPP